MQPLVGEAHRGIRADRAGTVGRREGVSEGSVDSEHLSVRAVP